MHYVWKNILNENIITCSIYEFFNNSAFFIQIFHISLIC